jgi:hypothetical protein
MSDPTDLNKFRKTQRKARARNITLCRQGFHKWTFDEAKQFDVKLGKLVSIQRCERCGATRTHVQ